MIKNLFVAFLMAIILHGCALVTFAQKIYVFSEGDVHDYKIGKSVAAGTSRMRNLFKSEMPENRIAIYNYGSDDDLWTGPDINQSNNVKNDILKAIQNCPAGPSDTIFFYWYSHGAFDEGGHYLWMPKNRGERMMYRSEILKALKAKNARLTVLMTESCHVYLQYTPPEEPQGALPPEPGIPTIFQSLFFDCEGVVDFNTSSPGQYAWCDPDGGRFSVNFGRYLCFNSSTRTSWKELLNSIPHITETDPNTHLPCEQDVFIWSLPEGPDHESEVFPHQWTEPIYHPESGDQIVYVNALEILCADHFYQTIRGISDTDKRIVLTLIDNRTGKRYHLMTDLLPGAASERLGIYVKDDEHGNVVVTRILPDSPGTKCSLLKSDNVESVESDSNVY